MANMRHLTALPDTICSLLIPICILVHLYFAPYTKVEESFNIQATHDILRHGIPWKNANLQLRKHYDHLTFTGPVPRTFVGPSALAGASWPLIRVNDVLKLKLSAQSIVRAVLGLFNAYCIISFRNGVARAFGRNAANCYAISQASQFHLMYYASRTLPNFFAFGLATLASHNLLPLAGRSPSSRFARRRQKIALILLTATSVIFRSEIAILLACHTIYLFLHPYIRLPILSIIPSGILGAVIGLILTVPLDTFLWDSPRPLWPELTAFTYNILSGNSSNWGISPWHFYLTAALPRLLFNPLLLILIPFTLSIPIFRWPALDILIPNLLFIAIYSFQPHKEWRFIVYTIPPILSVASAGASWIWTRRSKTFVYRVLALALVASTLASFAASGAMLAISRLNYPGGEALDRLHDLARNENGILKVHMDTLSCMTGITRFLEQRAPELEAEQGLFWVYDKTEDEDKLREPLFWEGFDYALAERPETVLGEWEVIDTTDAFAGFGIVRFIENTQSTSKEGVERSTLLEIAKNIFRLQQSGPEHLEALKAYLAEVWGRGAIIVSKYVTKGWWISMKMEPRIRVLKKKKRKGSGIGGAGK